MARLAFFAGYMDWEHIEKCTILWGSKQLSMIGTKLHACYYICYNMYVSHVITHKHCQIFLLGKVGSFLVISYHSLSRTYWIPWNPFKWDIVGKTNVWTWKFCTRTEAPTSGWDLILYRNPSLFPRPLPDFISELWRKIRRKPGIHNYFKDRK